MELETRKPRQRHELDLAARAHRRRLLRRLGLNVRDLDGLALSYVDVWSRSYSKLVMLDRAFEERGVLPDGSEAPLRVYVSLLSTCRGALRELAGTLQAQGVETDTLEGYLQSRYRGDDGGADE